MHAVNPEEEVVQIREYRASDVVFIANSWLKSLRSSLAYSGVPNDIYYQMHHRLLEHLIPRSTVLVLCNMEDPDQIVAWACMEREPDIFLLHYVYVKHSLRKNGFMSLLLREALSREDVKFKFCTHMTPAFDALRPRHRGWIYNPYALYTRLPGDWGSQ